MDALSRLTKIEDSFRSQDDDEYVRMVASHAIPVALRSKEVEQASAQDLSYRSSGSVSVGQCYKAVFTSAQGVNLHWSGHLRGTSIVMPQSRRKRVVNLAHEGHQGVVKTKERLRTKVWWPGMEREAATRCAECYGCQLVTKNVPPPPLKPTSMPQQPWEE